MIVIETMINAPVEKVWKCWTDPADIRQWNHASDDWHSPAAAVDLRPGGQFNIRMEAKDGSMGFDFWGTYEVVTPLAYIEATLGDGRKWQVVFSPLGDSTKVTESFEAEKINPPEMQRQGWMAILQNFRACVESKPD